MTCPCEPRYRGGSAPFSAPSHRPLPLVPTVCIASSRVYMANARLDQWILSYSLGPRSRGRRGPRAFEREVEQGRADPTSRQRGRCQRPRPRRTSYGPRRAWRRREAALREQTSWTRRDPDHVTTLRRARIPGRRARRRAAGGCAAREVAAFFRAVLCVRAYILCVPLSTSVEENMWSWKRESVTSTEVQGWKGAGVRAVCVQAELNTGVEKKGRNELVVQLSSHGNHQVHCGPESEKTHTPALLRRGRAAHDVQRSKSRR